MIDPLLKQKIINVLPYKYPFLFVDDIDELSDNKIIGTYTYPSTSFFYEGHFVNNPITPGAILLETMGQIGLVCFGAFLLKLYVNSKQITPILSAVEAEFHQFVLPSEKIKVISEKIYLRHSILKCSVSMINEKNETVANAKLLCKFEKS